VLIPIALGINDDHGAVVAHVHAARACDEHAVEAAILALHGEVLEQLGGFFFVADAGRAGGTVASADEDVVFGLTHFGFSILDF
jgi:hypothetical protein